MPALPGRDWRENDGLHIDVRGLDAPDPMVAILARLEGAKEGETVTVHHDREPIYLYPELAERGWQYRLIEGDPGEVRLTLTRAR